MGPEAEAALQAFREIFQQLNDLSGAGLDLINQVSGGAPAGEGEAPPAPEGGEVPAPPGA
jgi:hypothetical protein